MAGVNHLYCIYFMKYNFVIIGTNLKVAEHSLVGRESLLFSGVCFLRLVAGIRLKFGTDKIYYIYKTLRLLG